MINFQIDEDQSNIWFFWVLKTNWIEFLANYYVVVLFLKSLFQEQWIIQSIFEQNSDKKIFFRCKRTNLEFFSNQLVKPIICSLKECINTGFLTKLTFLSKLIDIIISCLLITNSKCFLDSRSYIGFSVKQSEKS